MPKLLGLLPVVILLGMAQAKAEGPDPYIFTSDGLFYFPEKETAPLTEKDFTNWSTVEYIFTYLAWNTPTKDLIGNSPGKLRERMFDFVRDFINCEVPANGCVKLARDEWPIQAEVLAAVLGGTPLSEARQTLPDDPQSQVNNEREQDGFRLMDNETPLKVRDSFDDWNKDVRDTDGATLSYLADDISGADTLSGKGALTLPIEYKRVQKGSAIRLFLVPGLEWSFRDVASDDEPDIEELTFGLSASLEKQFDCNDFLSQNSWHVSVKPFYLTDFDFDGEVIGASISADPHLEFADGCTEEDDSWFEIGSFRRIPGFARDIFYLVSMKPRVEYSEVLTGSSFIDREEGDRKLVAGLDLAVGIAPFAGANWEIKAGYSFLEGLSGSSRDDTDLWTAKLSYWISENMAISGEFEVGEKPATNQEVDQFIISLEFRQ